MRGRYDPATLPGVFLQQNVEAVSFWRDHSGASRKKPRLQMYDEIALCLQNCSRRSESHPSQPEAGAYFWLPGKWYCSLPMKRLETCAAMSRRFGRQEAGRLQVAVEFR